MVQELGKGAELGKADLKNAFRIIPVAKEDFSFIRFSNFDKPVLF